MPQGEDVPCADGAARGSPPIERAHAPRHRSLPVDNLVEQDPGRALRVFVQDVPQEGFVNVTELSARTKGWMGLLSEGTLPWGEVQDGILRAQP